MVTITTMDGREVVTLRDRDGLVSRRAIEAAAKRAGIPSGDSLLHVGRYIWARDGVRVMPEPQSEDAFRLPSLAAQELGRRGGSARTEAQARAGRANGHMTRYRITSRSGADMGVYSGATPEDAVRAMIADGGGEYGSESAGTVADYGVEQLTARGRPRTSPQGDE